MIGADAPQKGKNMSNTIVLTLPIDQIEKAIRIAHKAKKDQIEVDNERKAKYLNQTEADIRKYSGEEGVTKYHADLARFDSRKREIAEKAQSEIKDAWERAIAVIDDETMPKGSEIAGEDDFLLLAHDIVDKDQLERLMKKHEHNLAFRIACEKYAMKHEWPDAINYAVVTKEKAVREYCNQVFDNLMRASAHPFSAANMQYVETENEYHRLSKAYGIEEEYLASGGTKLSNVIKCLC